MIDDATRSRFIKLNPVNQPRSQQSSAGNVIRSEYLWIHTHRVIESPSAQPMYRCFSWYEFYVSTSWIVPAIYPVVIRCITLPCYSRSTLSPTVRHLSTILQDLYYYHQPKLIYVLPLISIKYLLSNMTSYPSTTLNHSSFSTIYFSSGSFVAHRPSLLPSPSSQCHSIKVVLTLPHILILSTMLEGTKTISMVTKSSKYLFSI